MGKIKKESTKKVEVVEPTPMLSIGLQKIKEYEYGYLLGACGLVGERKKHTPLTPEAEDVQAFTRLSNVFNGIDRFVKEGRSLYIYSQRFGNGKTTWASNILLNYLDKVAIGNQMRLRGMFVSVPDILRVAKNSISDNSIDFNVMQNNIENADLVVWDDISSNKLTEYEHKLLFSIIDTRLQKGKSNIYTSNLIGVELIKNIGQRLNSRVYEASMVVELVGIDRRSHGTGTDFK